jgi:F0F1-type ATP synthase assembly protein I
VIVAVLRGAYEGIREFMVQAGGAAASHALSVVSAERALGLFHEQAVQAVFVRWDTVTDAFDACYGGTHFLVPAVALVWLFLRHPERYARARTTLAVTTAVAFVCFWLYPVLRHWALRAVVVAYPVMTTLVVVATGNHYFLDAAAGTLLACLSWVAVTRFTRTGKAEEVPVRSLERCLQTSSSGSAARTG